MRTIEDSHGLLADLRQFEAFLVGTLLFEYEGEPRHVGIRALEMAHPHHRFDFAPGIQPAARRHVLVHDLLGSQRRSRRASLRERTAGTRGKNCGRAACEHRLKETPPHQAPLCLTNRPSLKAGFTATFSTIILCE